MGIDFGVLGPFTARLGDGTRVQLGALKPFRVLGLLLLRPGQACSAEWMITEVWGPDTDPRSGHHSLKSAVAQLNRWFRAHAGTPMVQHRRPDSYVVDAAVGVDSLRFLDLVAPGRADPSDRSQPSIRSHPSASSGPSDPSDLVAGGQRLADALALWRGPHAWPGFEDVPSLAAEAVRLEELRLATLHRRIDVDLQLGRHRAVVAELESLLAQQPEREDLCAQLMVALYRSGRQGDALAAFSRTVGALRETLGLDPGPALRRLERDILVHEPTLEWVPVPARPAEAPVAAEPPPPARRSPAEAAHAAAANAANAAVNARPPGGAIARPLVGRDETLARLTTLLGPASQDTDRLLALSGPPGVGKTRLLAELADRARGGGAVVLHGWSDPELDLPYQPIVELLRTWVSGAALDDLRAVVGPSGPDLARLVPEIADRLDLPDRFDLRAQAQSPAQAQGLAQARGGAAGGDGRGGPSVGEEGDAARFRLFDGFWNLLAAIGTTGPPALVVIDDLQWADFGTCQLLRYVVRRGLPPPVRLVLAGRERGEDGGGDRPGLRLLGDVGASLAGRRERLGALDEEATVTLVRHLAPAPWGPVNWALGRRIHQLTGGLPFGIRAVVDASPDAAPADDLGHAALDVDQALRRRISLLPAPTRELLRLAAVHGPTFDAGDLAELAERPIDDVVDDLEPARAAGVIVDLPARPDVYQFDHELSRRALEREVPAGRRARIQARLAQQAQARGAPAIEVARRRCAAVPVVPAASAFEEAAAAGTAAWEAGRYEEAAMLLEAAVSVSDAHPSSGIDELEVVRALVGLTRALDYEGDATRALATARRAMAGARRLRSAEWMAHAALAFDVHRGPTMGDPGQLELLEEAEAALGNGVDAHLGARVRLERLYAATVLGRVHADVAALDEVAEAVARLHSPELDFHVAALRCSSLLDPTGRSWPAALEVMERATERFDDRRAPVYARSAAFIVNLTLGDSEAAERALRRQEQASGSALQPWHRWNVAKQRVCLQLAQGRFDEARRGMDQVLQLGDRYQIADAWAVFATQLYVWSWLQGGVGPLAESLAAMVDSQPSRAAWRGGLGAALAERGDRSGAEQQLRLAVRALGDRMPDPFRRVGLAVVIELAAHLDQVEGVAPLVAELEVGAGQLVVIGAGVATLGPIDRFLGLGAALLGRRAEARARLSEAAAQADRLGLQPWMVMARADLDGLGPSTAAESNELVTRARALGMSALASRLETRTGS